MDEWDKIILSNPLPSGTGDKTDVVDKAAGEIFDETSRSASFSPDKAKIEIVPEKNIPKQNLSPKPSPSAQVSAEPRGTISPYVSKLPVPRSFSWAGKFATVALSIAVTFGLYSYFGHVTRLGFKTAASGTVDSVLTRIGNTSITAASFLFGGQKSQTSSLDAAPIVVVEVLDVNQATTSVQAPAAGNANFATETAVTGTIKLDDAITTTGPAALVNKSKPKPASPKQTSPAVPDKNKIDVPSPTISAAPEIVMKDGMYIVSYENNGFNPRLLEISRGKTVRFVNNSTKAMQIVDMTKTSISQTFFQFKTVGNGGTFEYTFNDAGSYEYANQGNVADKGTIAVK